MKKEIKLKIFDMLGTEHEIETPSDITVGDFIHELCTAMRIPNRDAHGNPVIWRLDDKETGQTLDLQRSLASSGVDDGHHLELIRATLAGCFPGSAQVLLPSGDTRAIGQIQSGDIILAYDIEMGSYLPSKAEGIFQQTYAEQLILNNQLITTSDQHLLMADRNWRLAGDIAIGDILFKFPFGEIKVADISREKTFRTMFSLTLKHSRCLIVDNFVVRDLIGKQALIPRAVDVFLSYADVDKDEARTIFDILNKEGATVFLSERNIGAGEFWEDRIKDALKNCRNFWILVTPNSLHSEWVITEWAAAWALDKKIIPILFRCKPEDLPKRLQAYQCVDFHQIKKALEAIRRDKLLA